MVKKMVKNQNKKEKGFTLLEVLVAMAILLIGLLAVAALQSTAARSNEKAKQMSQALALAETKVEEIINMDYDDCNNSTLTEDGPEEGFRVTYPLVEVDSPVADTKLIDVEIIWSSYGKNNSLVLSYIKAK